MTYKDLDKKHSTYPFSLTVTDIRRDLDLPLQGETEVIRSLFPQLHPKRVSIVKIAIYSLDLVWQCRWIVAGLQSDGLYVGQTLCHAYGTKVMLLKQQIINRSTQQAIF